MALTIRKKPILLAIFRLFSMFYVLLCYSFTIIIIIINYIFLSNQQ